MSDFPAIEATPLHIHSWSQFSLGSEIRIAGASAVAALTWTANQAIYIPFMLPWPYPVKRLFCINGSTIGSNIDLGIYSAGGARLASIGSTAQVGTSVVQYVALATPLLLRPGRYYMAYNCSGTTSRAFGIAYNAGQGKQLGLLTQAVGAIALPDPATFATYAGVGLPVIGFTRTASGF